MASTLTFVDSIAASPTTRLELNDGSTWRLYVGSDSNTEFPPPPLDQAIASTLLTDGAVIPSSAYGLRTLILDLLVNAASADAVATQLQNLYRELDRPTNILRLQHGTTNPVFFRTFRTSANEVSDYGMLDGTWKRLQLAILAEPFGYGLLETPVSGVTVSTDPAAVSNGCFVDVTGVKGDVESPALIRWPGGSSNTGETLFAVRRRGTPSAAPFLFQVEAMTQGADTSTQPNDANFSGAGNNYSRCTFATTATLASRLTLTDFGTPSVDLRGTYRVFLRYRKNTSGDAINLQLRWGDGNSNIFNDAFATPATTSLAMADLGLIRIPFGLDPVTNLRNGVEVAVDDLTSLRVYAERTSGSGTLDMDFLLLVPADDRLGIVDWPPGNLGEDRWWLDALDTSAHARNSSDEVFGIAAPPITGGLPMLTPNQTNRIFVLYRTATDYSIADTRAVTVSYYPLYLSVRPAST